jgi:hypothetical protein
MRATLVQVRWHETLPVFAADFHPTDPTRVATAGGDRIVRVRRGGGSGAAPWKERRVLTGGTVQVWRILPPPPTAPPTPAPDTLVVEPPAKALKGRAHAAATAAAAVTAAEVEHLVDLARHQGAVNVVRFAPNGPCTLAAPSARADAHGRTLTAVHLARVCRRRRAAGVGGRRYTGAWEGVHVAALADALRGASLLRWRHCAVADGEHRAKPQGLWRRRRPQQGDVGRGDHPDVRALAAAGTLCRALRGRCRTAVRDPTLRYTMWRGRRRRRC